MAFAELYYPVFVVLVLLITLFQSAKIYSFSDQQLLYGGYKINGIWLFCILFIVVVGLRPSSALCFGDSEAYAWFYKDMQMGQAMYNEEGSDVLFYSFMYFCSQHVSVNIFFLIIEIGYVVPIIVFCKKIFTNNASLAMLFCLGAFSFFSYGTNGLRHGLASSLVLLAYCFWCSNKRVSRILSVIPAFVAYSIHGSIILPILVFLITYYFSNTKLFMAFWVVSIAISLMAGGFITSIVPDLGYSDERLDKYLSSSVQQFRYDFLLYSIVPIIFGYIAVVKKKVTDKIYLNLLNTYILCNAFWVLVIHAKYSNRFAYLSWFLYPIVLAYPLLKTHIWKRHARITSITLFVHIFFTLIMMVRDLFR